MSGILKKSVSAAALVLLLGCSCVNIEYVGQRFPADPAAAIGFFNNQEEIPEGYRVIGRAEITAPDSYTAWDLRGELLDKAAEVGADAVAVVKFRKVLVGSVTAPEQMAARPTGDWTLEGTTADGSPVFTNSFGRQESLKVARSNRYQVAVQAVFLVTDERYREIMPKLEAEHAAQLEKYLQGDTSDSAARCPADGGEAAAEPEKP